MDTGSASVDRALDIRVVPQRPLPGDEDEAALGETIAPENGAPPVEGSIASRTDASFQLRMT